MANRPPPKPVSVPFALLVTVAVAAVYGAISALLPNVKLNVMFLIMAVVMGFVAHAGLTHRLLVNLAVACLGAVLAVVAMWGLWFGFEHGFARLGAVLSGGPGATWQTLQRLAATTSYRISGTSGPPVTYGPDDVRLAWVLTTALVALAPPLGALVSPLFARRRAAASA